MYLYVFYIRYINQVPCPRSVSCAHEEFVDSTVMGYENKCVDVVRTRITRFYFYFFNNTYGGGDSMMYYSSSCVTGSMKK